MWKWSGCDCTKYNDYSVYVKIQHMVNYINNKNMKTENGSMVLNFTKCVVTM